MPLESFICPDGELYPVDKCLRACRLGTERCMTLPTLTMISQERDWSGTASTTQLLNGTMLEFLKLTQPYAVDPDSRAFMLQGTKHHKELELVAQELGLAAEIPLSIDRDIFDLLEFEGKELCLTDYKLWGSFKVAQALGIVQTGKEPHPTDIYKSSGKWGKAGSPKMVPTWGTDPDKADNYEVELQLNRYRVMLKELGITVHKLRVQATVRDGGLYVAKDRGVLKNVYMIPVKIMEDEYVERYFAVKDYDLHLALREGWDTPCTASESWDGMRCERYCDVWSYCPKGVLVRSIGGK